MASRRREPTRADHYAAALDSLTVADERLHQVDLRHLRYNPEAAQAVRNARKAVKDATKESRQALTKDVPAHA